MPSRNNKTLWFFLAAPVLFQTFLLGCNGYEMEAMVKKACAGKMGLCIWETKKVETMDAEMGMEMEMEMDSEINRRVLLMQKKYISYETLKRDTVPCDRAGASYYNCHAMGRANPYSRGCENIGRCRNNGS